MSLFICWPQNIKLGVLETPDIESNIFWDNQNIEMIYLAICGWVTKEMVIKKKQNKFQIWLYALSLGL